MACGKCDEYIGDTERGGGGLSGKEEGMGRRWNLGDVIIVVCVSVVAFVIIIILTMVCLTVALLLVVILLIGMIRVVLKLTLAIHVS